MKRDLIWGWIFIGLALLMAVLVIYCCFIGNWAAVPMCSFALAINVCNAINRFTDYKRRQQEWKDYMTRFNTHQPKYKPDDDNRITN